MPSFVEIGPPVLMKIFEVLSPYKGMGPSWSCYIDYLYKYWLPLPIDASYKTWLCLAKQLQRLKIFENVNGQTHVLRFEYHSISSFQVN